MLPYPSGEEKLLCQNSASRMQISLFWNLDIMLIPFLSQMSSCYYHCGRVFLKPSRDTEHHQWTRTLGTLVVTQDDPKHNVRTSFHKSADNTTNNATRFSPLVQENEMETTMRTMGHLCADSRKVGWGKRTTSPTFSLLRKDTTHICDNTPDYGNPVLGGSDFTRSSIK